MASLRVLSSFLRSAVARTIHSPRTGLPAAFSSPAAYLLSRTAGFATFSSAQPPPPPPNVGNPAPAGVGDFREPFPTARMGTMNFVRSALDEDEQFARKRNADFVHILMMRKKTFVTVTDAKGNRKAGASAGSAGSLEERKGRSRSSRYAAEATAEYVGRLARKMGVKSVVVKVKGSTTFKRKSKSILSWREGFQGEGVGQSPIMYIQDVTQLPHGGCRLPKRRRT